MFTNIAQDIEIVLIEVGNILGVILGGHVSEV